VPWMLTGDGWELIPVCKGLIAGGSLFDPTGAIWGRSGHWPLFVQVGSARSHSDEGHALRDIKWKNNQMWQESKRLELGQLAVVDQSPLRETILVCL
jgi:hypothetical protein